MKKDIPIYIREIRAQCNTIDEAVDMIIDMNNIIELPVNIIKIAENMGFKVFSAEFKDKDIKCVVADCGSEINGFNEKRVIAYDKNNDSSDNIFMMAHAIGHFVMHCDETHDFIMYEFYDKSRSRVEREANKFARALLVPRGLFMDFIKKSKNYAIDRKQEFIAEMSLKFLISNKNARKRLKELNLDF